MISTTTKLSRWQRFCAAYKKDWRDDVVGLCKLACTLPFVAAGTIYAVVTLPAIYGWSIFGGTCVALGWFSLRK